MQSNEKQNIIERKEILTTQWAQPEIVLLEYIGCDIKENFPYLLESQEANSILTFISIYTFIVSWTCTDKGSLNVKALSDSADKRSPARPFTEGQEKRGHSSPNSNLFRNLAQSGFNRTGRSCPEPAADWPSAEHRAWALRKFSAPCSQGHGKSGRVRAAALQDSQEPRPLFASAASFRWSLNLFFKGSRLGEHSEGKPEVGRGKLGTRRRRFGAGRMGGLSNFLSWVSWGGGLRRRGKGRCQLASPRGLKGVRLILSCGALEAPVSSWCFGGFFELVMRPGVCCREPAEPALCGQPGSEPAGRWMAWGTGRERCGGGGQSPGRAAALPLGSRAEAGCLTMRHVPAATLAATSR